jgi:hypothetical protein
MGRAQATFQETSTEEGNIHKENPPWKKDTIGKKFNKDKSVFLLLMLFVEKTATIDLFEAVSWIHVLGMGLTDSDT